MTDRLTVVILLSTEAAAIPPADLVSKSVGGSYHFRLSPFPFGLFVESPDCRVKIWREF